MKRKNFLGLLGASIVGLFIKSEPKSDSVEIPYYDFTLENYKGWPEPRYDKELLQKYREETLRRAGVHLEYPAEGYLIITPKGVRKHVFKHT